MPSAGSSVKSKWLSSPLADFFFVFGGLLLSVSFFLYNLSSPISRSAQIEIIGLLALVLSGGHLFAPFFLLMVSRQERERVRKLNPKIHFYLMIIFLFPLVFYGTAAALFSYQFSKSGNLVDFRLPIAVVGFVWFVWNAWHFGMQHFGVLQIYRSKMSDNKTSWRKYDFLVALFVGAVAPGVLMLRHGVSTDFISSFVGPLKGIEPLVQTIMSCVALLGVVTVGRLYWSKSGNLPLYSAYVALFSQAFLIWHMPLFFSTVAFAAGHWLQEIFLISHIYSSEKTGKSTSTSGFRPFYFSLIALFSISGLYMLIFRTDNIFRSFEITPSGKMLQSNLISPEIFWIVAVVFSILNFISNGHKFLDRLIYKGRSL